MIAPRHDEIQICRSVTILAALPSLRTLKKKFAVQRGWVQPDQFQLLGCQQFAHLLTGVQMIEVTVNGTQKDTLQQTSTGSQLDSEPIIRKDESFYFVEIVFLVGPPFCRLFPTAIMQAPLLYRWKDVFSKFLGPTLSGIPRSSVPYSNSLLHRMVP